MYPLPTTNFSTTHYKPYIATNSYNSLQSDRVFGKNNIIIYFFTFYLTIIILVFIG